MYSYEMFNRLCFLLVEICGGCEKENGSVSFFKSELDVMDLKASCKNEKVERLKFLKDLRKIFLFIF